MLHAPLTGSCHCLITCTYSRLHSNNNTRKMKRSFNPITQTIVNLQSVTNPGALQTQCQRAILQSINIRRINDAVNKLPLPSKLRQKVSEIRLKDFVIDPDKLIGENYLNQSYPATCCLLNDSEVILKVQEKGSAIDISHPSYIAMFEEGDVQFLIFAKTETLKDVILRCKNDNTSFQENFIWKILYSVTNHILEKHPSPMGHLTTSTIHFSDSQQIYIEIDNCEDALEVTNIDMGAADAVYDAPEVINRDNPTDQAFSWSIGCIIYEMLALEAAFYDREGFNPFAVIMQIMEGEMPPPPPVHNYQNITDLMWQCLKIEPNERPTIQSIFNESKDYN